MNSNSDVGSINDILSFALKTIRTNLLRYCYMSIAFKENHYRTNQTTINKFPADGNGSQHDSSKCDLLNAHTLNIS